VIGNQKGGNAVPVIYAAPFILLSIVSCLICLAIPRFREKALQALVAPVAFGFCSVVGMLVIDTLIGHFYGACPCPEFGMKGILVGFCIYAVPGILGAWFAVNLVGRIKRGFQFLPPRA
jgi:hypothetical protein